MIGSMASGKSTQRRLLCKNLSDDPKVDHDGDVKGINYSFATFGNIAALGKVKENGDGMCDGLDAAFGKIKKEGGELSLRLALRECDVVIIEGSQTSLKWFDFIKPLAAEYKANIYLIHFKLSYDDNLNRLRQRQSKKLDLAAWEDTKLSDKNIESIIGKNQQFNNIFDKLKNQCYALQIDALKPPNVINEEIIDYIFRDPEGI